MEALCDRAKKAMPGQHPDIYVLEGENGRIYMKHVEAMKPFLVHRSEKRLICIPHADEILPEAASALLKVLEEPSASTRFLLGTRSRRSILPTIRSRCRTLSLSDETTVQTPINIRETLERLSSIRPAGPFLDEELHDVERLVHALMLEQGASIALFRVSQRLRDYYKSASLPGGNMKLAADILLASLAELRNTISYANTTS